jgi:hypothetical protein
MTTIGGGQAAAYGLKYQYLATLDYYLRFLQDQPELIASSTLVVEPLLIKPDGDDDDDIVDFSMEIDDLPAQHVQVKATTSPADYPLQPAKARETLNRLLSHAAIQSTLLTNKPLSPELAKDCTAADPSRQPTAYRWTTGPQPSGDAKAQPLIAVDTRSPAEIRASIVDSVRHFRGHRARRGPEDPPEPNASPRSPANAAANPAHCTKPATWSRRCAPPAVTLWATRLYRESTESAVIGGI